MSLGIGTGLTDANIEALNKIANDAVNNQKLENQSLGKDAFLELMMTQLAHQDPLSPLDNQEMIAQMAQFSSVEQMGLMNENMQTSVDQNDQILETLLLMAGQNNSNNTVDKMEELITKTDVSNELNTNILNELIKLNKAMEAYEG
jgi:flagellar basal-body rod modification protein FlgD